MIKQALEPLNLPDAAIEWLVHLFDAIQFFDDVADGDKVERKDLDDALWSLLISMPTNPFYAANSLILSPIIATQILKWQASDKAERAGRADEQSFIWRAGYYDVVLMVVCIVHGQSKAKEAAETVLRIYGEKYADYKKEFEHA
jgi:hypothetical protein